MGANLDLLKSVYDGFAKGDVPAVLGAMDENVDWNEPESLPYKNQSSPQAVAEGVFGPVMQDLEGFTVNPEEFVDGGGDVIVAIGRYRGKGAKTGVELDAPFTHVWRFSGGKISYFRTYTDTKSWLDAIGDG